MNPCQARKDGAQARAPVARQGPEWRACSRPTPPRVPPELPPDARVRTRMGRDGALPRLGKTQTISATMAGTDRRSPAELINHADCVLHDDHVAFGDPWRLLKLANVLDHCAVTFCAPSALDSTRCA